MPLRLLLSFGGLLYVGILLDGEVIKGMHLFWITIIFYQASTL